MGPASGLLAFALLAGAVLAFTYYLKQKRRQELAAVAAQLGLAFAVEDTVGFLGLPFSLLGRGDGRGTESVMWGTWQGIPVTEFDYWYYEESTECDGQEPG